LVGLALLSHEKAARADIDADAEELARRWREAGLEVTRLPPMFLEHGRPRPLRVPASALDVKPGCTTVAFLTGRSTDFAVRVEPFATPKHQAARGHIERSIAGAVLLAQCGASREALERVVIELRVARSALETVVAVGARSAPAIAESLPQRASGPIAPLADPGPRSGLEPLTGRARQAEQRAKTSGASGVRVQTLAAERDGSGREALRLEEGCHRIEMFAELLGKRPVDLDAELRETTTERLVARDRSDAPDVRLDVCAGATMGVELLFAGAPGAVPVMLLDAVYPLPKGVPTTWGARARAGLSAALWRRKVPPIDERAIEQRLGVAGVTSVPIPIEPGSCYVAAIGTIRGEPRSITLTARVDTRVAFDSNAGLADGAAVAFCSAGDDRAWLEAEVRGSAVAWVLEVWQLGRRPFDEGR